MPSPVALISVGVGQSRLVSAEEVTGFTPAGAQFVDVVTAWSIADPAVATISSAGPAHSVTVTGVAPGTTTLTITLGGLTGVATVQVPDPAASGVAAPFLTFKLDG